MFKSYVVGFSIFPKGKLYFKTKFVPFNDKKQALGYYNSLKTENKIFYESVDLKGGD